MNNVSVGGGVSTIEVTVPVEVTIPVEVTVPGETVTVAGDTVTVTVEGEPVTVTVEAEPTTVTVQADPKTNPTFSLGEWAGSNNTYSAVVSYNGDGVLTANTGTLSGSTITVEDADGNFNGVISAAEGTNFAPSNLVFNHTKETVGGAQKLEPTLTLNEIYFNDGAFCFSGDGYDELNETATITYNGDGILFASAPIKNEPGNGLGEGMCCYIYGKTLYVKSPTFSEYHGYVYASEGEKYAAKSILFKVYNYD